MELQTNVKTGDLKISSPETTAQVARPVVGAEPELEKPEIKSEEVSLVTRASQVKIEPQRPSISDDGFDYKEIENIKDLQAREYAEKAYKSFQRGWNEKYQELAELRKSLVAKKTENAIWTPERIQDELLSDPTFIQSAQKVSGVQPLDDGNSMLSESDRKLIA